ncbi:polycomb group protein EMBRYONIC FLOWER 2 isoform X2 [Asparagus officinalis]|uniref:polycomb group protein EMBRYONIC FLOWER 2 isoform X2 n=1 Tax=Asparagus officinalis TaxID=4686 RepID=UPI00098E38AF|nr:polycomb group protein EMBRYONIC FLOWER 2 isoform X2 [Asparagus officinalis]
MPGLPLLAHETTCRIIGCSCSQSRTTDQMCRQQSRSQLTAEEALAAEESLTVYCKPVELYNILQRRAIRNPSFLQRCLHYKIQEKHKRRIHMTISLSGEMNADIEMQNMFPLYVILARPLIDISVKEQSAVYRVNQAFMLTSFSELGRKDRAEASFTIPEMNKLSANGQVGHLTIILVGNGEARGSCETCPSGEHDGLASFPSKLVGDCFWGRIPIESLRSSLEKCVTWNLDRRVEMITTSDMYPTILKTSILDNNNCLAFGSHNVDSKSSFQVQVTVCAQEVGAREKSPYDSYSYDNVPASSLPHIIRLRTGNVLFNYKYYNNTLQKTEVTEDFSCPFCLVQCASFKGLRYHLCSCHDLFNFEFWVSEEYQAVNVSVRTDVWRTEVVPDGFDPRLQTFFYRSKFRRPRRSKNVVQNVNHVHPHVLEVDSPEATQHSADYLQDAAICSSRRPVRYPMRTEVPNGFSDGSTYRVEAKAAKALFHETQLYSSRHKSESYGSDNHRVADSTEPVMSSPDIAGACTATTHASTSNEYAQLVSGNNLTPPTMLQFAKTRKLSVERADPRNRQLLQKRQFFHSHRAQPMALEQVFSDRDSEDEVDDDIADFEDRRMLDDFVDVTKDEKQIMHLWNSFVRKQRVLADGHIPWACEAFSLLHGRDLVRAPALIWCWRLFMVKLWNHSLLDARAMNNCNIILGRYQNEISDPKQGRE